MGQKKLLPRQVLQGDAVQDGFHLFLNFLPDGMDRAEGVPVAGPLVDKATVHDDGAFHGFDDFQQGDLLRRPTQDESAPRSPVGFNQPVLVELLKNLGQRACETSTLAAISLISDICPAGFVAR